MKIIFTLGIISTALLLSACHQQKPTTVITFTPFKNNHIDKQYKVKRVLHGHCIESLASQQTKAWRCFAGNEIHDPCFSRGKKDAICLLAPWQHSTIQIITSTSLQFHKKINIQPPMPWAIELDNGARCAFMTGATGAVKNLRINYGCTNKTYLLGKPNTSKKIWTIQQKVKKGVKKETIKTAWY